MALSALNHYIMTSIGHLCMNLYERELSSISLTKKRCKAAWNDDYRARVIFSQRLLYIHPAQVLRELSFPNIRNLQISLQLNGNMHILKLFTILSALESGLPVISGANQNGDKKIHSISTDSEEN